MNEFTCYKCQQTFLKRNDVEWNDDKAREEWLTLYPETKDDPVSVLCDDCNVLFRKWFSTLTIQNKLTLNVGVRRMSKNKTS